MKANHQYFVYVVKCSDGLYYTGITNDLERRLIEHNEGLYNKAFTFTRRPVILMYHATFEDVLQAIAFEKQLKGWSRKKKEALFENNIELLKRLSKSSVTLRQAQGDKNNLAQGDKKN